MFVEKWMTENPVTLPPDITISAAAIEMASHRFRHIPVAEATLAGKKLLGLVSKYDIARAFPPNFNPFSVEVSADSVPQPISTIMARIVTTVRPDCSIEEAACILRERRINALPVLRGDRLVGIITESDIFDALIDMTGANGGGIKMVVEAITNGHPVVLVAQLSQQHHVQILSFVSCHDNQLKGKELLAFRFAARPTADFIQALTKLGFRILTIG